MEYFVDLKIHNPKNEEWAMKTTKHTSDYEEAKKEFFAICQQYENTAFDKGVITLIDERGGLHRVKSFSQNKD